MSWSVVERDWFGFLGITFAALPLVPMEEMALAPVARHQFRDILARCGQLTADEADELIEYRLLAAYRRAQSRRLAA